MRGIYDPDGQFREYQRARRNRQNRNDVLLGIAIFCALVFAVAGAMVTMSLLGK